MLRYLTQFWDQAICCLILRRSPNGYCQNAFSVVIILFFFFFFFQELRREISIQELVLDFVNVKGQELSGKVEENTSIEADLQQINDMWSSVQELVTERTRELRDMVAELSDFEEDLGRLGDILNYTEVCFQESETSKESGYNELENQLAKLKVSLQNSL